MDKIYCDCCNCEVSSEDDLKEYETRHESRQGEKWKLCDFCRNTMLAIWRDYVTHSVESDVGKLLAFIYHDLRRRIEQPQFIAKCSNCGQQQITRKKATRIYCDENCKAAHNAL